MSPWYRLEHLSSGASQHGGAASCTSHSAPQSSRALRSTLWSRCAHSRSTSVPRKPMQTRSRSRLSKEQDGKIECFLLAEVKRDPDWPQRYFFILLLVSVGESVQSCGTVDGTRYREERCSAFPWRSDAPCGQISYFLMVNFFFYFFFYLFDYKSAVLAPI